MNSRGAVLLGTREPRYLTLPPSADGGRAGLEAIDLGATAGIDLFEWQQDHVKEGLAENADGTCAAGTVAGNAPRQNGKDEILLVVELAWLYIYEHVRLITHTAHRFDTCLEHFYRLRTVIEDTPDLSRKVRKISDTNGKESITLKDGTRILFKARSKASGRGFSGNRYVFNEAMWLRELASMIPSLSAMWDPQLWFFGSAPLKGIESDIWRALVRRGRAGDPDLTYWEHSAHPEAKLDDPNAVADANPSLGRLLSLAWILNTERKTMTTDEFALERFGIFDDSADGLPPKIEPRDWKACRTKERGQDQARKKKWMRNPVTFAIAVTPDQGWSTIAAAGACREGGIAVEIIDHRMGTDWVAARCAELLRTHKARGVAFAPGSPAGFLLPDLKRAGIKPSTAKQPGTLIEVTAAAHAKAAGHLYDRTRNHTIVHRSEPELDAIVAVATARPSGEAWVFNRNAPVPSSPLEAVELAAWAHHSAIDIDMSTQVH